MRESDTQRACFDYLEAMRIPYLRLNAGDVFRPGAGGKMYRVKGAEKGTSDCLVLACTEIKCANDPLYKAVLVEPRPIFVEFKSDKGKQTPEQKAFEEMVKHQGYEYYVVRDLDELIEVLA